ncbi:MAG: hypothetical protein V3S16_14995, partial [Candidatus Desulfatibia sp.]|uniref:hypothetical protein n=1 Tax=Candidatus Desulfatibia sp. TaxID=3101189 RepID=UPI002F32C013
QILMFTFLNYIPYPARMIRPIIWASSKPIYNLEENDIIIGVSTMLAKVFGLKRLPKSQIVAD